MFAPGPEYLKIIGAFPVDHDFLNNFTVPENHPGHRLIGVFKAFFPCLHFLKMVSQGLCGIAFHFFLQIHLNFCTV